MDAFGTYFVNDMGIDGSPAQGGMTEDILQRQNVPVFLIIEGGKGVTPGLAAYGLVDTGTLADTFYLAVDSLVLGETLNKKAAITTATVILYQFQGRDGQRDTDVKVCLGTGVVDLTVPDIFYPQAKGVTDMQGGEAHKQEETEALEIQIVITAAVVDSYQGLKFVFREIDDLVFRVSDLDGLERVVLDITGTVSGTDIGLKA